MLVAHRVGGVARDGPDAEDVVRADEGSHGVPATLRRTDFYLRERDGDISARVVRAGPEIDPSAIPANGNLTFATERAACGYEGVDFPATMEGSVEIADARGNSFTLTGSIGFVARTTGGAGPSSTGR
jgi:hypothetical protein